MLSVVSEDVRDDANDIVVDLALCATAELRAAATAAYPAVAAALLPSCRRGMGAGGRVAAPKAHLIVIYIFYSPLKNMVGYKFSLSSPPR